MRKTNENLLLLNFGIEADKLYIQQQEGKLSHVPPIIFACYGKPTYPANIYVVDSAIHYWNQIKNNITKGSDSAIDYGEPEGDAENRSIAANALTKWYQVPINKDCILFTVGATGAFNTLFNYLKSKNSEGYLVVQQPYYPLYLGQNNSNNVLCVNVMDEPKLKLTQGLLRKSLKNIKPKQINAFVFCDPNNPLGTSNSIEDWQGIIPVLHEYPEALIIIDESYTELQHYPLSLLSIAPELRDRIIIIRSCKGFSMSGERLSLMLVFNEKLYDHFKQENIAAVMHAPRSLQYAYAMGLTKFNEFDQKEIFNYYNTKFKFVKQKLNNLNILFDKLSDYNDGTFYILANLTNLKNQPLPLLVKTKLKRSYNVTKTDEDIAYYLLYKFGLAILPLSYMGAPADQCLFRLTCTGPQQELQLMMDRLQTAIMETKKFRYEPAVENIEQIAAPIIMSKL